MRILTKSGLWAHKDLLHTVHQANQLMMMEATAGSAAMSVTWDLISNKGRPTLFVVVCADGVVFPPFTFANLKSNDDLQELRRQFRQWWEMSAAG